MANILAFVAAWAASQAVLGDARAADAGRSAAIVVEGNHADEVSAALAARIPAPHSVRDPRQLRAALTAHGTRSLHAGLGSRARDAALVDHARLAAADAHVDMAVLVDVKKGNRGEPHMHVWLVEAGGTGSTVDADLPLVASDSASDVADAAWQAVAAQFPEAPPVAASAVPPAAASAGANGGYDTTTPGADMPSAPASVEGAGAPARETSLLAVQADGAAASRHFSYVDRLTPTLRPYDLPAAPFASIAIEVYPLAGGRLPLLRGLGLVGDYGRAAGVSSADSSGARVGTTWQSYDAALRERISLGPHAMLGVDVGYGANDFDFDQPSFSASLPTVDCSFVRAGLDMRFFLGSFSLLAGGGYLDVVRASTINGLFPRETVGGMDAFVGVAFVPTAHVEVSARLAYTRFFYSFDPQPGDANVAGGALDELGRLSLGLAYLL